MATNTPNLNLVKPEMSDYADIRVINKNMDIIDNAINEIMTSSPGLPPVNATGDLTVNGKTPVYVLEKLVDDTNEKYKITAIKYSDGMLRQTVTSKIQNDSVFTTVTFLVPFTNVDDIILNSGVKLPATDDYKLPYTGSFKSVADLSTTGAKFHFANDHMYWDYTFIGYWK